MPTATPIDFQDLRVGDRIRVYRTRPDGRSGVINATVLEDAHQHGMRVYDEDLGSHRHMASTVAKERFGWTQRIELIERRGR